MAEKPKKENIIGAIKTGLGIVGDYSTMMTVCGVVRAVLPPQASAVVQGVSLVGGLLLGSMLSGHVVKHVENCVDETVERIEDAKEQIERNIKILRDEDLKEKTEE